MYFVFFRDGIVLPTEMDPNFSINIPFEQPMSDVDPITAHGMEPAAEVTLDDGTLPVTYGIMENGSQRGGVLLYDNTGYQYTKKSGPVPKNGRITWRCTVRNGYKGGKQCNAKVYQVNALKYMLSKFHFCICFISVLYIIVANDVMLMSFSEG